MVVNPDKFQSIIINRLGKLKNSNEILIDNHKIHLENSVTLLGIEIDNKLNFGKHVTTACQKAGRQLNALSRIHKYIGFQKKKMLLDCFIFSNLTYCLLVWHFSSAALSQKIERVQERALRLLYNDSFCRCNSLLSNAEWPTMEVNHLWKLAIEVFKTIKYSNPDFMYTYFKKDSHSARRKNGLVINRVKTTTFGEKSLRTMGPKIWNSIPEDAKDLTSPQKFTEFIKTWYKPECKCNIWKHSGDPYHYT